MFSKNQILLLLLLTSLTLSLSSCGILKEDCDCPNFSKTQATTEKHA
jgi:hypothetical protein